MVKMKTELELQKINDEISNYPTPVTGCDEQFNYLLQRRSELEKELGCPQHVIDEHKVEEAIERMYQSEQQDMFNDPDMNWSGLR